MFSRVFHSLPIIDLFLLPAWMTHGSMLPGSYIFPALSICNQLFPATCFLALFILCHHWLVLVTSMDHAWIVTMLPGCYIFPLFPSVTRYIFSRAYLWLVLVTSMDSIHVASYMFSRVFLLLSVLFFYLSPSSSDCFREFFFISFVFDRPVFNSIFIVLQILQQFPTAFEFIPMYLVRIAEHVNSQW